MQGKQGEAELFLLTTILLRSARRLPVVVQGSIQRDAIADEYAKLKRKSQHLSYRERCSVTEIQKGDEDETAVGGLMHGFTLYVGLIHKFSDQEL